MKKILLSIYRRLLYRRVSRAGQASPTFEEEPDEHQRRYHPNLKETLEERRQLELQLAAKLQKEH